MQYPELAKLHDITRKLQLIARSKQFCRDKENITDIGYRYRQDIRFIPDHLEAMEYPLEQDW